MIELFNKKITTINKYENSESYNYNNSNLYNLSVQDLKQYFGANILLKNEISAICTGVDDKLLIYTTQENGLNDIRLLISTKIGIHQSAISVIFITEFPRNESGKILYSKLHVN